MFTFTLSSDSGVPTYLQLAQEVKNSIRLGHLRPGDRLPTAKDVVEDLAVNPNTVLKAYRELRREDLVSSEPGAGTFVRGDLGSASPEICDLMFQRLLAWMDEARSAGLDGEDISAIFAGVQNEPAAATSWG